MLHLHHHSPPQPCCLNSYCPTPCHMPCPMPCLQPAAAEAPIAIPAPSKVGGAWRNDALCLPASSSLRPVLLPYIEAMQSLAPPHMRTAVVHHPCPCCPSLSAAPASLWAPTAAGTSAAMAWAALTAPRARRSAPASPTRPLPCSSGWIAPRSTSTSLHRTTQEGRTSVSPGRAVLPGCACSLQPTGPSPVGGGALSAERRVGACLITASVSKHPRLWASPRRPHPAAVAGYLIRGKRVDLSGPDIVLSGLGAPGDTRGTVRGSDTDSMAEHGTAQHAWQRHSTAQQYEPGRLCSLRPRLQGSCWEAAGRFHPRCRSLCLLRFQLNQAPPILTPTQPDHPACAASCSVCSPSGPATMPATRSTASMLWRRTTTPLLQRWPTVRPTASLCRSASGAGPPAPPQRSRPLGTFQCFPCSILCVTSSRDGPV